mgnify:CR=1 FL=1
MPRMWPPESLLFAETASILADALSALSLLAIGVIAALTLHWALYHFATKFAKRTKTDLDELLFKNTRNSARMAMVFLALQLLIPACSFTPTLAKTLRHGVAIGLIASITWLVIRGISVIDDMILARHPIGVKDNLRARQIHTKTRVLSRSLIIIVSTIGVAAVLMTFDSVRDFGKGLAASAGVAGIVLGFAGRATIANLIAGVQLALTQPIRIDDVVIVEGEWGWIEEIRSTFVIVKIWDDRRLVVPLNYFIEQPFQNWTRKTADLLGSVFIHADYRLPVQRVREELERIVKECEEWDGRVCVLQVTDAKEQTIELRALVSAADSPTCWDLRCKVREKLVGFIQSEFPDCLPRVRAEIERDRKPSAAYTHKDDIDAHDPSLRRTEDA